MARLVYSTDRGRLCPTCGWPADDHPTAHSPRGGDPGKCKCSARAEQPVPAKIVAKLRMEKSGRGGKTVTVVYDLPRNTAFLKELAQELKRACGTGGAVVNDTVELQGDLRDRVRDALARKGYRVKG